MIFSWICQRIELGSFMQSRGSLNQFDELEAPEPDGGKNEVTREQLHQEGATLQRLSTANHRVRLWPTYTQHSTLPIAWRGNWLPQGSLTGANSTVVPAILYWSESRSVRFRSDGLQSGKFRRPIPVNPFGKHDDPSKSDQLPLTPPTGQCGSPNTNINPKSPNFLANAVQPPTCR